jgi:hypothetical protein
VVQEIPPQVVVAAPQPKPVKQPKSAKERYYEYKLQQLKEQDRLVATEPPSTPAPTQQQEVYSMARESLQKRMDKVAYEAAYRSLFPL